jgi:hypothetical protein
MWRRATACQDVLLGRFRALGRWRLMERDWATIDAQPHDGRARQGSSMTSTLRMQTLLPGSCCWNAMCPSLNSGAKSRNL